MKVLQLIDSLNAGGAERVAVNYANALTSRLEGSYLCTSRSEGLLKESVSKDVHYLFLNKKYTLDFKAISKLHRFIKRHGIDIVHAHASSFFLATIIKILHPKLVVIWHEHYGNREKTSSINKFILKISSHFFSGIIAVNDSLKTRSEHKLLAKKVYVLSNFPTINLELKTTTLHGESGKRIVCLANLRPDKDHINLLKAFNSILNTYNDWSLHLIGAFSDDECYHAINGFIEYNKLDNHVFVYGSCSDVHHILRQSTIGVLSSKSEGLPLALLEYGLVGLPVIATNVGDCNLVISNKKEGLLIEPENEKVLANSLLIYIKDVNLRQEATKNLHLKVLSSFSESKIIESLIKIYKQNSI